MLDLELSILFNPIISGVSASGDLDTSTSPLKIQLGNADRVGHCSFELQNISGSYSTILLSGNATLEIDVVKNQVSVPLWKGTIEKSVPQVDISRGSVVTVDAYDFSQELLNVVSPDARAPYLLNSDGTVNILSGDGGAAIRDGLDLVSYTSGPNSSGNVTVSQFMSQWFGTSGDHTGSISGSLLSFKPYISGYTWKTYYWPDVSGGAVASDNNANYFLNRATTKAKHEYGWDALRKITRQQLAVDSLGNKVAYEMYTDVSGAIHMFTSGSYEVVASGATLVYYVANASGSTNNNIIRAQVPYDLTHIKNVVEGWFPDWTIYPYDGDYWTDFFAYSGGAWTITAQGSGIVSLSGNSPAIFQGGFISIMGTQKSGPGAFSGEVNITLTLSTIKESAINLTKWNVSGTSIGVGISYDMKANSFLSGLQLNNVATWREITLFDGGGNTISRSGGTATNSPLYITQSYQNWNRYTDYIFKSGGVFNSGDGQTSDGWKQTGTFDFTNVTKMIIGFNEPTAVTTPDIMQIFIDNLYFTFDYPFSPVTAFNSGSQGLYGRRYGVVEFPSQLSDAAASGLMNSELQARMGSQGLATFIIRDNANLPISAQLTIKPGHVFVVDAPVLATGSGQPFNLWRANAVEHNWSKKAGFETMIMAYPYYSGTQAFLNNFINYMTPLLYTQGVPPPEREQFMPIGRPWPLVGR